MPTVPDSKYGFDKVNSWTQKELAELQKTSKTPIIVELANGDYTVGTSKVEKVSSVCWRVNELEFADKRSAIFYCALTHLSKTTEACELYAVDAIVGKLDSDKSMFRYRLDKAHEAANQFKISLYSSRYEDTKVRLIRAKQELTKLIMKYKYLHDLN